MKQLWAPWRLQFILNNKKKEPSECVFCDLLNKGVGEESLLLASSQTWSVILNRFPYNNGHVLLVPKDHVRHFSELKADVRNNFGSAVSALETALRECYQPEGMNFGYNLGKSSGAGIPDHLHAHMLPRWAGDTNFMPILAETKCIPDHLETMYAQLQPFVQKHFKEDL